MNKTTYYINGNAVRELDEAAPVRRPQKSTRELEEIRRKKNRRTSARRNQERALSMNRAFVAFLTACVAASALVSVSLIQIRSNVTQQMKEVAALESQINDMGLIRSDLLKKLIYAHKIEVTKLNSKNFISRSALVSYLQANTIPADKIR
jgi:cell division protein FtsL